MGNLPWRCYIPAVMAYLGEIAATGTALLWACSALLFTLAGRRIGPGTVNISRLAIGLVLIALIHLVSQGTFFPLETEMWRWGILALSAFLGLVIGDGALFFAFVMIGPRLAMLIMTLVPVFSALFAWICFGETIALIELLGMVVTIGAIAWVVSEDRSGGSRASKDSDPDRNFALGIVLTLVGVLGQTANLVVTKYALVDGYSELSATEIRIVVSLVILWLFVWMRGQLPAMLQKIRQDRVALFQTSVGALFGPVLGIWLSYVAIVYTRIGIAATIMALPPLLLIPLSARFLKDRVTRRSVLGTMIAIGGVGLIFLCGEGKPKERPQSPTPAAASVGPDQGSRAEANQSV